MVSANSSIFVSAARYLQIALALAQNEPSPGQLPITANCTKTCKQLGTEFPSIFHPGNDDPDFAIWDAKAQGVQPACRVEPGNAVEVARVLEIAVENRCQIAIKSGGHSTNRDASNSVGGVTVDLVRINHVRLLDDHIQADFGPGLILRDAYAALEPFNLSNFGGRTADVGLAGYTIGGGLTALAPKFGLALDNVFEYEVSICFESHCDDGWAIWRVETDHIYAKLVLPNSTIVNVSEQVHPDLYFALRGGGNNFGIITNFRARVVPQGQRLGGGKTYSANYTDQLIDQGYQLATTLSNDLDMAFHNRYFYTQSEDSFSWSFFQEYNQPVLNPSVFDGLNQIPSLTDQVRIDHASVLSLDEVSPHGFRRLYATVTFHPSRELHRKIIDIFAEEVQGIKATANLTTAIVVQALHINSIKAMNQRGGNALGIESDGSLLIALLTLGWGKSEDDTAIYSFAERWTNRSRSEAEAKGLFHPWQYINYAGPFQDPFSSYGEASKLRLQEIQRNTDPAGIFTSQGLVRGSFKLL
ncbi:FAD binding domain-containing protein [Diaporthe amygdali]|uniref:FAD binding domain-containing protein n=1 Tax=Phomopsis amygdali TaxID=1214568 RepID=UPI0022FEDED1|nr:FAD binding domain-containing protein [Diaporthe amygdali]KAJ0121096.1 FAD binding domain-containing protein [Diaporthe amygdali]